MDLPAGAEELCKCWAFVPEVELEGGHCSKVFADAERVLKVPFDGEELTHGVPAALKLQDAGGPKVFESDLETGVVLMERFRPGTTLLAAELRDEEAQDVFIGYALRLRELDPSGGMTLDRYITMEHPLKDRMIESTTEDVFLHGDLHHANLLRDGDDWRPIDPKGLTGDAAFECVAFLRNPWGFADTMDDPERFTWNRIHRLAQALDLDPWRIAAWSYVDRLSYSSPDDRLLKAFESIELRLRT